jgi:potassium/hydrogen antiporter
VHDTQPFALVVFVAAVGGLLAVMVNRLTSRLKVPAPAFMLIAAAVAVKAVPGLEPPPDQTVERLVTVALLCILFDGGMHIGWGRFRAAAAPTALVGVMGTFLTVAGGSLFVHLAVGFSWYLSVLVATAVAPTDPAVVFSVLGLRQIAGRSGTILEGESGANDPVGIALMASLVTAGGLTGDAAGRVALEFALQMAVGLVVGVVGARLLLWFMRRVPLPNEALYPLRVLACVFLLFGATTLLHGSGFLAVFVAGIVLGDERAPYKREIERFHSALASLGEIVAFVALGLTVNLSVLSQRDVWIPGLGLGLALAVLIRPVCVGMCLLPARLDMRENVFVLFAGLKGAVPILLGSFILLAKVASAERLYGIVVVVVVFSVIVQGSLVPLAIDVLGIPTRTVEPEPWALGVRLRDEPNGVHRFIVAEGAPAQNSSIRELTQLPEDVWVSLIVRDQQLVNVTGDTRLRAGDEVLVLGDPDRAQGLRETFEEPR